MRKILIIGAGKSASYLVKYFLDKSISENLDITIGDFDLTNAKKWTENNPNAHILKLNIFEEEARKKAIESADIVVSMLPARFHIEIAKDCLSLGKHMVTASYVSKEMQALNEEAKSKNLVFLNEIGVDPGIDHMSAMQVIDRIRESGGKLLLFESFTGGLMAPESDTNLWNYKFTWNPRNVVLAGQGGAAKFLQESKFKYIPYHRLFRRTEFLEVDGYGRFEAYANRDSLKYKGVYGLDSIQTLYRGTIRRVGFSRAWQIFVILGLTDDSYTIADSENMSYRDFVNSFLPYSPTDSVELKLRYKLKMYHKFGYELNGEKHQIDATMVCTGDDQTFTAMAKTVGLPVGIATLAILNNKIKRYGVQIPINKDIYEPILSELESFGVIFKEKEVKYLGYNPLNQ